MLWVPTSDDAHVADKETLEEGEAALGVDLGQIHGSLAALLGLRLAAGIGYIVSHVLPPVGVVG